MHSNLLPINNTDECLNCKTKLQTYYIKPDGDAEVHYKRCINCLTIYYEVKYYVQ